MARYFTRKDRQNGCKDVGDNDQLSDKYNVVKLYNKSIEEKSGGSALITYFVLFIVFCFAVAVVFEF